MTAAGQPAIGETVDFTMGGFGANLPLMVFSLPFGPSTSQCAACPLGVDLAFASVYVGSTLA